MIDIFVSYSRRDKELVKKLVEVMQGQGWSVWWDPTIRPGEYFEDVIEEALFESKCVVVIWSQNSVKSKWVRAEAAEAANREVLVPVVIDDAKIPFRFKQIQEARLVDWQSAPDHPELIKLFESIAEKCTQAQNAPNNPPVSELRETEAKQVSLLPPPLVEQANDPLAPQTSANITPALHLKRRMNDPAALEAPASEIALSSSTNKADDISTTTYHPQSNSKRNLVVAILIVIGLGAATVIYFAAFRDPTKPNDNNQIESAQQNGQPKVSNMPIASPDTTPSVSLSPDPVPTASPAVSPANTKKIERLLTGKWQSQNSADGDCFCAVSPCLDIQFSKTISDFCLDSQVGVSAYFKLDAANNKAYLFFTEPGDMGAGAMRMPWDKFDRKKPLATIDLSDLEAQRLIYVT